MGHYVGARYVPKFANPLEWAENTAYEAMTVVSYNNNSYTSKIPVPSTIGNPADNSTYWALTGNYNAQVEQYRQETENYNTQVEQYRQETENYNTQVEQYRQETSELNKTSINVLPYYKNGTDINTLIDDNVTLFFPKGEYIVDLIINKSNVTIKGNNATIKGSITVNTPITVNNTQPDANFCIDSINLTKNLNNYAIRLIKARHGLIHNVKIDNTYEYGIYQKESEKYNQPVNRITITACTIQSSYGFYSTANSTMPLGDITISDNYFEQTKSSIYVNRCDGIKIANNTFFTDVTVTEAYDQIYCEHVLWLSLLGNTLFESSKNSIHVYRSQQGIIADNIIGFCGEVNISDGIYMEGLDNTESQYDLCLYNICNNFIFRPSGNGINCGLRTCHISIQGNYTFVPGSTERYRGTENTNNLTKYCVNYPLMNNYKYGFSAVYNNFGSHSNLMANNAIFKGGNQGNDLNEHIQEIASQEFVAGTEYKFDLNNYPRETIIGVIPYTTGTPQYLAQFTISKYNTLEVYIKNNYTSNLTTSIKLLIITVKSSNIPAA